AGTLCASVVARTRTLSDKGKPVARLGRKATGQGKPRQPGRRKREEPEPLFRGKQSSERRAADMIDAEFSQISPKFSILCTRSIGAVVFALLLALAPLVAQADPLSPPPAGSWAAFPNSTLRPAMTAVPCSS